MIQGNTCFRQLHLHETLLLKVAESRALPADRVCGGAVSGGRAPTTEAAACEMEIRVETILLVWIISFIVYTLQALGTDGGGSVAHSFSVRIGDYLFSIMQFSLGVTLTVSIAWTGSWWLYSTETRTSLQHCAVEFNPSPAPPAAPPAVDEHLSGVLVASLEHVVPSCKVSVTAGGLGKVLRMQLLHAHHTPHRRFFFVFPMVSDADYSLLEEELPPLQNGTVRVRARREGDGNIVFVSLPPSRTQRSGIALRTPCTHRARPPGRPRFFCRLRTRCHTHACAWCDSWASSTSSSCGEPRRRSTRTPAGGTTFSPSSVCGIGP